jgi:chromosome transmission fidelity protein 8
MPSTAVHPPSGTIMNPSASNPLPTLLQTPSGLALLELQGTIHIPPLTPDGMDIDGKPHSIDTSIGKLVFPYYSASKPGEDTAWMKRVHLYIGKHQRMTGEVKKLPKAMGIMRKREGGEDLEIVEIVKHKIVFSNRPEPVTNG